MRKYVTRTLNNVYVKCGCVDPKTLNVFEKVFRVKNVRKPELLLSKLQREYNAPDLSVVSVLCYEVKKTKYRLSEDDFMNAAEIVSSETTEDLDWNELQNETQELENSEEE